MKHLFTKLLDLALKIASIPKAVYILFTISFFESFFFIPLPPDFILAPMVLSKPQKAWFYAGITLLDLFMFIFLILISEFLDNNVRTIKKALELISPGIL